MSKIFLIDVRSPEEYKDYHKKDAVNIPVEDIYHNTDKALNILNNINKKEDTIYVYCASGSRAEMAKMILLGMGFEKVENIGGCY